MRAATLKGGREHAEWRPPIERPEPATPDEIPNTQPDDPGYSPAEPPGEPPPGPEEVPPEPGRRLARAR
jgi:hypothetical protein